MRRDWSNLQSELLGLILRKLFFNFIDIIHFQAVCKTWHSVQISNFPDPPLQLPWLVLSLDLAVSNLGRFFSLSDGRIYSLPMPESCGGWCSGSSRGWLFMIDGSESCYLLNPITKIRFLLPSIRKIFQGSGFEELEGDYLKAYQGFIVSKVVLSSSPTSKSCEACWVMVITRNVSCSLAVCKLGDDSWSTLKGQIYDDITYFKGKFYAADNLERVVACEIGGDSIMTTEAESPVSVGVGKIYLVESAGELLFVRRLQDWCHTNKTVSFQVLQQDLVTRRWVQVQTLGNHSLFLGNNHSLSLLASDYSGCKSNCIYFTENGFKGGSADPHDVGIFNMADGVIEPLPGYILETPYIFQSPIWVTPSPM